MLTMEITRLIERCRQGDTEALGELYKAYAQRMRSVCRRYINDEQTVDDVLHDAFIIIFTSFDRLRDASKAESWMMSITRNVASKYKEHLKAVTMVPLEEAAKISQHSEQATVKGVPLEEMLRMVERLLEGYGQIFRLSVFEGMTHKEIATMLGIEPHSSSSQLARAKKMLRKMMRQYWALLLLLFVPITILLFRKAPMDDSVRAVATTDTVPSTGSEEPKQAEEVLITKKQVLPSKVEPSPLDSQRYVQPTPEDGTDPKNDQIPKRPNDQHPKRPNDQLPKRPNDQLPKRPTPKWSLELAYAGQFDEQNRYSQPYSYKPKPSPIQSDPTPGPTIPSSIDNWTDYAVYLSNNPDAVSASTRSFIMRIALNNANRPGEDKILRSSHHQMPVTWSLALKYKFNDRFGLESGLSYSRLSSDFEMGTDGNVIREHQTIHYLGIPLKGIYNMYSTKQWSLYGSLGLTTEIPVHSTLHSVYYLDGIYGASDKTTINAPWQFSPTLGLGLQYHLTPSLGLFAEPSLQYFIPMKTDIETYRTEHPLMFSLPLGIRFTW